MKNLQSIIAILFLIVIVISFDQLSESVNADDSKGISTSYNGIDSEMIDEVIFPHDEVVEVNINIDSDVYEEMLENAMAEEYVMADITYNGYTFNNIAIRPKGNSSLKQVATTDSDRFSFKVDLDKYIDGQNFFGITKLNLNNIFNDETYMAEFIAYEMLDTMDAVASDTTYVALYINDVYQGLYLAVEEVNESFLLENFGNDDGTLYKPDMGRGADLEYISEEPSDYLGIEPQDDDMETDEHFVELVSVIDQIVANDGETEEYRLDDVMNVDSFLQYLAMSSTIVHMDSYQGGMYHNYYLYYNTETGLFEWITWDLNMTFNGFPMSGLTDEESTQFLLDEPVIGNMSQYPVIEAIFTNESYVETYHEYVEALVTDYLADDFEERLLEIYQMIEPYASTDPTAFYDFEACATYTFDTTDDTILSLVEFAELRVKNIRQQLNGVIPSTNNGEGNVGTQGGGKNMMPGNMENRLNINEAVEERPNGQGNVEFSFERLPEEILIMYKNGTLPEEITTYLDQEEMPPMDLIIEFLKAQGIMPEDTMGNQENLNNMPEGFGGDAPENVNGNFPQMGQNNVRGENNGTSIVTEDTMDSANLIVLGSSLLGILALNIFLKVKK